jgi:oligopeptide/dipeptide ABC transporter ATP-binding protein
VEYDRHGRKVRAVAGVDLTLNSGEILGLVGESGCGKSTLGKAIVGILAPVTGEVIFDGEKVKKLTRGKRPKHFRNLQMIFQDPYGSLNPRRKIGVQIADGLIVAGMPKKLALLKAADLLEKVGLPRNAVDRFAHQFSGGQRQRISIARALAAAPTAIIADEPISALDTSSQAQVANLLVNLVDEFDMGMVFISHDLSIVRRISDRVAVMYLGKIMELAPTGDLYANPRHPYTKALLSAVPIPDPKLERSREHIILKGDLPSPINPPTGCVFNTRCWKAQDICRSTAPQLLQVGKSSVACHFPE